MRLVVILPLVGLLACRTDLPVKDLVLASDSLASDDADGDGVPTSEDCDDGDASTHPEAEEVCDGVDNDCDGQIDEAVMLTWFADADGDGFGDSEAVVEACAPAEGFVGVDGDCDDANGDIWPGALEACNLLDDDCDGEVDEDLGGTWYADVDGDGHGDPDVSASSCEAPEGMVALADDCDDTDASVFPGHPEQCDEVDNDCDGEVDEEVLVTYWVDFDGDGFGDLAGTTESCTPPPGYAEVAGDCDDENAEVNPDVAEACNGVDDDCDGDVDEADSVDARTWYADTDEDTFGDPLSSTVACAAPSDHVADASDCDDGSAAVNPDATEICNAVDDDCDGLVDDADGDVDLSTAAIWYTDGDGDGYGVASAGTLSCSAPTGTVSDATDCDDGNADVHPGATEVCNTIDDDCDALVDDDDPGLDASTGSTWYRDGDGDGYGSAAHTSVSCAAASDEVSDATDCDDGDADVHPGATEVCNSIDDDCDSLIDDDDPGLDASTASTWYTDSDGDGFGDASASVTVCEAPSGVVEDDSDCDDGDADVHPDALEYLDGDDDDCDGDIDEAIVAMVFATQCLDNEGHDWLTAAQATQAESDQVELYLDDMGFGMDRYDEVWSVGTGANLEDYEVIFYTDCGWSWGAGNQAALDEMLDARDLGIPTFAWGDDLGWSCGNVTGEEELTLVTGCYDNGDDGTVTMTGSTHDAYLGPYGTPSDFYYDQDMDQVIPWTGVTTLAYSSAYGSGNPVWTAYEDSGNGSRAIGLETSIYMNNHDQVPAAAEPELEIIFKNSVSWLLDL